MTPSPILRLLVVLLLAACAPARVPLVQPTVRSDAEDFIDRAVFADGRLWLLTGAGKLLSLAEGETKLRPETPGAYVLGLCAQGGQPVLLTGADAAATSWTIMRGHDHVWQPEATLPWEGAGFVGLLCDSRGVFTLTSNRLLGPGAARGRRLALMGLESPRASALLAGDSLYVGWSFGGMGEGGLQRFNLATCTNDVPCKASEADGGAVVALEASPFHDGCVLAASGLHHGFWATGRVSEVCGDEARLLLKCPFDRNGLAPCEAREGTAFNSLPFHDVVALGDSALATAVNGARYRIRRDGFTPEPDPEFTLVDGLYVSFTPEAVLVAPWIGVASPRGLLFRTVVR